MMIGKPNIKEVILLGLCIVWFTHTVKLVVENSQLKESMLSCTLELRKKQDEVSYLLNSIKEILGTLENEKGVGW